MSLTTKKLVTSALIAFVACFWAAPSPAQDKDDQARRVDALFAAWDKPNSPGCALGVIRDGKMIYARGYGAANLEHNVAIATKTVFDIGSTSKQFTAASIVLLARLGKLSLEDDVRKYLPELPDYGKPITVRNLLNHTSGIRDYLGLMSMAGVNFDDTTNDDDALRIIARQKALNFAPGDEFLYSNSGFFLLSVIVKRASGKTLREFAEENIFKPLGMTHTHFHDDHTMIVPLRATAYSPSGRGGFRIDMSNFEQTGDGAVYTTVEDLALWDQNFYDAKVGGRAIYDELLRQGVLNSGKKLNYACGLMVDDYKGLKLIHHGGGWAGYRAELIRFPEQRFSVICLSNLATFNPSSLARQVADIYLADQFKSQPAQAGAPPPASAGEVALSEQELKEKAGAYRDPKSGVVLKVSTGAGRLVVDYAGMLTFQAIPLSKTRFRGVNAPVEVTLDFESLQGNARMIARVETQEPVTFERINVEKPSAAQLVEYAGAYYSEELDVVYNLAVEGDRLKVLVNNRGQARPLEPGIKDTFSMAGSEVSFAREQGRVVAFSLNAGRVKGIRFLRK